MESILSALDFKALGVGGIILTYMFYQNHLMRKDLESERDYSRRLNEKFHSLTETLMRLEQAVRDSVR